MVELCELKLMSNGVDCWPPDIDQHVAQLDFGDHSTTSLNGQSSIFASMALDPSVISTDSMDMSAFRLRCENNKNDYKLTNFEDSGQWTTTSGIGASVTTTANNSPPSLLTATKRQLILQRLKEKHEESAVGQTLHNTVNHFGLALLEQLNNLDLEERDSSQPKSAAKTLIDNLINHNLSYGPQLTSSPQLTSTTQLTTWGRIPQNSQTPPFEDKTYSLPELHHQQQTVLRTGPTVGGGRPVSTGSLPPPPPPISSNHSSCSIGARRPPSLLANFVEQQQQLLREHQNQPADYHYSELYVGDGRYVDVNENEIGFVPHNTAAIQKGQPADRWNCAPQQQSPQQPPNYFPPGGGPGTRYAQATLTIPAATTLPTSCGSPRPRQQRTFADLSPSCTAPDLKFLSMSHKVPSLCRSTLSLDNMLKKAREGAYLMDCNMEDEKTLLFEGAASSHNFSALNNGPDSGLGSSSSSGPLHIEDWPSLAALLPRHVVDACSFFKTNTCLLTGSDAATSSPSNNIERKLLQRTISVAGAEDSAACRTCFSVRRRHCLQPPNWAQPTNKRVLCNCAAAVEVSGVECCCATTALSCPSANQVLGRQLSTFGRRLIVSKLKLHAQELSIVGLPIYEAKRNLVERVVEGVAEIARGASSIVLWSALERLLADGLMEGNQPWNVIVQITGPGPATNNIFQLVKTLEASEKPENSRIDYFFREVLKLNSLEGWLSYVVLKENVLARLYTDTAFLIRANTAYRSLFWRLVESLELLSVLSQCHHQRNSFSSSQPNSSRCWGQASRLPSDSRVPKSSSMPARLNCETPVVVVNKAEQGQKGSLLEKAVEKQEARIGAEEAVPGTRPSTSVSSFKSSSSSRIPTIVSSPYSSTHRCSSSRPRSRSTLTSTLLSPTCIPSRSRSLLRAFNGGTVISRIPVRVFGSPAATPS